MLLLKCCKVFVNFRSSISVKLPEIPDFTDFIHFHIVNKQSVTMIIKLSFYLSARINNIAGTVELTYTPWLFSTNSVDCTYVTPEET